MIFLADIGNTRIKFAQAGSVTEPPSVVSVNTPQVLVNAVKAARTELCVISSVVPLRTRELENELERAGVKFHVVNASSPFPFPVRYKTPWSLGSDRLVSVTGAYALDTGFSEYIITIDFGTATTVNILSRPEGFLGGVIAPGVEMMTHALHEKTAKLPLVTLEGFDNKIGDDTESSLQAGVLNATLGLIEKVTGMLKGSFAVYYTGGNAHFIKAHLPDEYSHVPDLQFFGLRELASRLLEKN
ncbi:MAG: type III pantothenate kinase [Ignavibacteriaceae bacterium]|nr:type III pantothenate kinase [Ignavibacteriaceae bacterium]